MDMQGKKSEKGKNIVAEGRVKARVSHKPVAMDAGEAGCRLSGITSRQMLFRCF